jgi:hypothetical protein
MSSVSIFILLGLGRPPDVRYRNVVAWNRAATVMLTDHGALPAEQRNILRFVFLDP